MLRAGLFLGFGLAFAINGLIASSQYIHGQSETTATQASYLLQVYAGFFLCLFFLSMFCIACREWRRYKVNYVLIFELNQRHNMDWRQLAEFGALFMLYLGLIMSLNFDWIGAESVMYTYWPAVMLAVSAITIFLPLPIWYHRSRMWFVKSTSSIPYTSHTPKGKVLTVSRAAVLRHLSCGVPRPLHRRPLLLNDVRLWQHRALLLPLSQRVEQSTSMQLFKLDTLRLPHHGARYHESCPVLPPLCRNR